MRYSVFTYTNNNGDAFFFLDENTDENTGALKVRESLSAALKEPNTYNVSRLIYHLSISTNKHCSKSVIRIGHQRGSVFIVGLLAKKTDF